MAYQNYRGDFTRIETFYREDETGIKVRIPVPEHIRVEYFTKECAGKYMAERNGDKCESCSLSEDGMSLIVYLSLSRNNIGQGEMFVLATEFIHDPNYEGEQKIIPAPAQTGVILWHGASDGGIESRGETVLMPVLFGYSSYELARKHGYTGTEEEYANGPVMAADQARNPPKIIDGEWWVYNAELKIYQNTGHTAGVEPQVYIIESKPMEVMHKRNSFPSVTVIDSDGNEVEALVTYPDRDTISVDWNGDLNGMIYII